MNKTKKIAYCIPSLYYPSGMERVLTLKANYFAEHFGYDIHIILTDGKDKQPYYPPHPSITIHQLDINYDELYGYPLLKRFFKYYNKQRLFKKKLNECLCTICPDITISLLRRDINFVNKMKDGSTKIGEIKLPGLQEQPSSQLYPKNRENILEETADPAIKTVETVCGPKPRRCRRMD